MVDKERMKEFIRSNSRFIEVFQWSIMNAVASLVYCEYLNNMRKFERPVPHIKVVPIKVVRELLDLDSDIIRGLSSSLIPYISSRVDFPKMEKDFISSLQIVLDEYILPNVGRRIPETIAIKFQLNSDQQTFREDRELNMFKGWQKEDLFTYLNNQVVLQFSVMDINEKESRDVSIDFTFKGREIMVLNNDNAICPICFNFMSICHKKSFELINKITSTTIEENPMYTFHCKTSEHNQVKIISVRGLIKEDGQN